MKLKNKQTGQIVDGYLRENGNYEVAVFKPKGMPKDQISEWYHSLAELNEEWEDYEEPKEYYLVDVCGEVEATDRDPDDELAGQMQSIGNYFETREEAEKAVEKLKAWKRLKDKDFQFHGHNALGVGEITFSLDFEDMDDEGEIGQLRHDLDLLFSEVKNE